MGKSQVKIVVGLLCLMLGGCLPVELSVGPNGSVLIPRQEGFVTFNAATGKATLLYQPQGQSAVFGLYAPGGKSFLAITQAGNGAGTQHLAIVNVADGKARPLTSASNITYAQWSPDGKTISFTRLGDNKNQAVGENVPELHLVDVATGKTTAVASAAAVAVVHRWSADSKSIYVFAISGKDKQSGQYTGDVAQVDVATGKLTPLCAARGPQGVFISVAPDGSKLLFNAYAAGPVGTDMAKAGGTMRLYELTLASKQVHAADVGAVKYALYSPKGDRVLLGCTGSDDNALTLQVTDANLQNAKTIADDAVAQVKSGPAGSTDVYPTWADDDTVLYLAERAVYGVAGRNLTLMSVKANGTQRHDLQPVLDNAVAGLPKQSANAAPQNQRTVVAVAELKSASLHVESVHRGQ